MSLAAVLQPVLLPVLRSPFEAGFAFNPRSLFAAGEQGLIFDPSDFSTMFQDSAGTTPVTAVGDPVGLILDKSQGVALGNEQQSIGTVSTVGAPGTLATYNTSTGAGTAYRLDSSNSSGVAFALTANKTYKITVTASASCQIRTPSALGSTVANLSVGAQTIYVAGGTLVFCSGANATGVTFTISSIKEIAGNHASQATTTSRPTLRQITGGYWGLRADGVDDSLASTTGGGGTAGFLACGAITVNGGAASARTLWSDAGTNTGYLLRINASNQLELAAGNGAAFTTIATAATLPVGEKHVLTAWDDGVNLNVQIDNGVIASIARLAVSAGTAGFTLFKDNGAASAFAPVDGHQLVYVKNTAKTAAERALLKTWMGRKVGLSL